MSAHSHSRERSAGKAARRPAEPASVSGAAALDAQLRAGCRALGLDLQDAQAARLLDYLDLIRKWNAVYNLTAIRTLPRMLVEHLFDALAALAPLAQRLPGARQSGAPTLGVVDVGSGAGLPGIPIAIAWPHAHVHLVEPIGKKAAFLRQCALALGLPNLHVHEMRVEDLRLADPPDLIICRAFASLADFLAASAHLSAASTLVCAMKGVAPVAEIAALGAAWAPPEVVPVAVPGLDAARHLVLLRRAAADDEASAISGDGAFSAASASRDPTGAPGAPSSRSGA